MSVLRAVTGGATPGTSEVTCEMHALRAAVNRVAIWNTDGSALVMMLCERCCLDALETIQRPIVLRPL